MPNNYLSMLYQHIIHVEKKNVGLKVEGHKHTIAPPVKKVGGGAHAPLAPPLPTPVHKLVAIQSSVYLCMFRSCIFSYTRNSRVTSHIKTTTHTKATQTVVS